MLVVCYFYNFNMVSNYVLYMLVVSYFTYACHLLVHVHACLIACHLLIHFCLSSAIFFYVLYMLVVCYFHHFNMVSNYVLYMLVVSYFTYACHLLFSSMLII